ncbi:MAG: nicotinamide riboside transporter PnuC, partial [Sphingobacteriales bacterium]
YYTVVSIYGWYAWTLKDAKQKPLLQVSFSGRKQVLYQLAFFAGLYTILFLVLSYLEHAFYPGVIPWADAFASATAFTAMWLMARKKVESWYWWIATNIASIPLYLVKDLQLTGYYYMVLLVLAVFGLLSWRKKAQSQILSKA